MDSVVAIAKAGFKADSSFANMLPYRIKQAIIDENADQVRDSVGQVVQAIPSNLHSGAYTTAYQSK